MSRILIVEDEPDIAQALADDLTTEGYAVEVAGNGEDACQRARETSWSLILLDVMLPRKDGFEVCRELRRAGISTPIIFLTARAQEAEKILGLELGGDDYVTKPFSPRELRARIKTVLRRLSPPASERYQFDDVVVDVARGEVTRAGQVVDLTPIEFRLLCTFIERRGRVLTREQLLDAAWSPGIHVIDRAVDTHIVNLRRKLEAADAPRCFVSVRGRGYRFDG
jgi:two-component system alkaline phosphatase synthesis response regulator PhoP